MFETTMLLPRCDNIYKVHAWLADRMGAHRKQGVEYLHVGTSCNDQTVLSVLHDKPLDGLSGSREVILPAVGAVVKFRARLNPLRKQGKTKTGNKRRVGIQSYEIQDWLQRQVEGVDIETCEVVTSGYEEFVKGRDKYWFWRMDVEGTLRVNSVQDMERFMPAGVGRMKGFGYGLLAIEGMMAFEVLGL